jgi:mono/diheme cytochrome c family protein
MKGPSRRLLQSKGCSLLMLALVCALGAPEARAQNIDEGKSAQQLYAATCVACHRNPGALAKGRFRPTLFAFLQDHYTTGSSEAWALASYLAEKDTPPRSKPKNVGQAKTSSRRSQPRPPAPVPQRN